MKLLRKLLIKLGLWTVLAGEPYNFLGCKVHREWPYEVRRRYEAGLTIDQVIKANPVPKFELKFQFLPAIMPEPKITNRVKYSRLVPVIG